MIILHDPDTLLHETVELLGAKVQPALESPARIEAIVKSTKDSGHDFRVLGSLDHKQFNRLLNLICVTHRHDYLEHLQNAHGEWVSADLIGQSESILPECFVFTNVARSIPERPKDIFARAGYYAFDMSSGIMNETFRSVVASANLALEAADIVMQDAAQPTDVFALCRPPGHHCDGQRSGGYCYVNNITVTAAACREKVPDMKIGILDIDFHHGNGTQEIFYSDPHIFYTSIHGEDEFPYYTGTADEQGKENAIGTNLNLPLKTGSSFEEYLEKLEIAISALEEFRMGLLLVSLGFDTFYLDPLGNFKIETDDYFTMAQKIRQRLGGIPAVILLEGGYVIDQLGPNVLSFIEGWEEPIS